MQAQHPSNKSTQTAGLLPKSGFQEMQPQQPLQGLAPGCPLGPPLLPSPLGALTSPWRSPEAWGLTAASPGPQLAGRQYSSGTAVALTVTPFPQTIRTLQDANFSSAGAGGLAESSKEEELDVPSQGTADRIQKRKPSRRESILSGLA